MENEVFLSLAAAFVNETAPALPDNCSWEALMHTATLQNLLPVLAYMNKKYSLNPAPAPAEQLNGALYRAIYLQAGRAQRFLTLSEKLTAAGIDHMPVKGWYIKELYPEPELRSYGDIDILIRKEDRQRCHALLLAEGFTAGSDWEPTYSYIRDIESYEFHTNLMDGNLDGREDLQAYFSRAWDHAEPREGRRFEPEKEFHFIYCAVHLAKHLYAAGAGLRMYMDLALFIRRFSASLNWAYIEKELEGLGLTAFFHTLLAVLSAWFGVKTPLSYPEPPEATLRQLTEYTLNADLFGKLRDNSLIRVRNAGASSPRDRLTVIRRRIFPPAAVVGKRYAFVAKRPWLLPVGWLARLIKNAGRVDREVAGLKRIAETDSRAVAAYDSFMQSIGL